MDVKKLNTALNLWSAITCGLGVVLSILMIPASGFIIGLLCAALSGGFGWWFFSTFKKRYLEGHKPEAVHHVIAVVLALFNGLVTLGALIHNVMLMLQKD